MKASVVDLRYHMKEVLQALKRRERIDIFERNKLIGHFVPVEKKPQMRMIDHPFIGSAADDKRPVLEVLREWRKPRDFGIEVDWSAYDKPKKSLKRKPRKRKM